MRPEANGVWAIDTTKKILPKVPEDVQLLGGIPRGGQDAGWICRRPEAHQCLSVQLSRIEPARGISLFRFPFGTVGTGEHKQGAQAMFVLTQARKFVDLPGVINTCLGAFVERSS